MTTTSGRTVWLARIGALVIRALASTWRVRFANPQVKREMENRKQSQYQNAFYL